MASKKRVPPKPSAPKTSGRSALFTSLVRGGTLPAVNFAAQNITAPRKHPVIKDRGGCVKAERMAVPFSREHQVWQNWGILDSQTTPGGFAFTRELVRPTDPHEIAHAIRDAEQAKTTIRAVGSGWSFSEAPLPQTKPFDPSFIGVFEEFGLGPPNPEPHFGRVMDMTSCMSTLQSRLPAIVRPGLDHSKLFFAEGGMLLGDLNVILDHQNPRVALETLGGSQGQTLAGAIATGTHGGDFELPPICDLVQAIYLIGTGGKHHWIEPKAAIADRDRVVAEFPCIDKANVHFNDKLFEAALVSVGAFGVVYAVVIRVVAQFSLVNWNRWSTWDRFQAETGPGLARAFDGSWTGLNDFVAANFPTSRFPRKQHPEFYKNRFLQVVINPVPNVDGRHDCYVTNRAAIPLQFVAQGPTSSDLGSLSLLDLIGAIAKDPNFGACPAVKALLSAGSFTGGSLVEQAIGLIQFAEDNNYAWVIRAVVNFIMQKSLPLPEPLDGLNVSPFLSGPFRKLARQHPSPGPRVDVAYKIMTGGVFESRIPVTSIEAAFGIPEAVAYIDFMLEQFRNGVLAQQYPAGYLSLRVCAKSRASLAIQQHPRNAMVEIALLSTKHDVDFITTAERAALGRIEPLPGRPKVPEGVLHWGQSNGLMDHTDVLAKLHRLGEWKRARAKIAEGRATFVNDFMRRCGLV